MSNTIDNIVHKRGTVFLHEFLKLLSKTVDRNQRIELLKIYHNSKPEYAKGIQFLCECLYHPAVKFNIPEGPVEYKVLDAADETCAYTNLFKAFANVKYLCFGPNMIQNKVRRESMFIQMLEQLAPNESKLLIMIKDKKLDKRVYPLIDESIFREAFPQWFPKDEEDEKNSSGSV